MSAFKTDWFHVADWRNSVSGAHEMFNLKYAGIAGAIAASVAFAQTPAAARDMPKKGFEATVDRLCSPQGAEPDNFAVRAAKRMNLSDAQKAALKDLQDAHQKAVADAPTLLCNPKPDISTFASRLAFHEKMLETHLATVKATRPKLEAFYNSLDDKQKKAFASEAARLDR